MKKIKETGWKQYFIRRKVITGIFFKSGCDKKHSIFLAGPTPRDKDAKSWRPEAWKILFDIEYDGIVIIPESERIPEKFNPMEWEHFYLTHCDVIAFWVPREIEKMPAFTTNIEFGRFCSDNRSLYGRPDDSPKNRYLDWMYKKFRNLEPYNTLSGLMKAAVNHNK